MLIEHATCLTVCLSGLGGWRGVNALQRRFQIKASSSFISLFISLSEALWSCWRSLWISEHLSWRGSSPRLAFPQRPPPPTPALLPSSPITLRFSLCTAKLPISTCMITEHSDLYSGESGSTSVGRRAASAPAAFMPHYKNGMKSEWSCCLSALKLFAVKF